MLCVPRVNEALWSDLEKPAKSRDLAMQDLQKCMLNSARPLIETIQMTKVSRKNKTSVDLKLLLECLRNALTCLGNASYQASMRRREFLKPELSKNFRSLCSSSLPLTKYICLAMICPSKSTRLLRPIRSRPTGLTVTNQDPAMTLDPLRGRSGSYRHGRYCQGNSRSSTTTRSHQELKDKN